MKASEILKCAVTHLEKRGGWTQSKFARDKAGDACQEDEGVSFCALGAIRRCARYDSGLTFQDYFDLEWNARVFLENAVPAQYGHDVITWNDASVRRKKDVLTAFGKAIAAAEEAEGAEPAQ